MIVVDTNVIVYLFITGERTPLAKQLLRLDSHWVVPPLWKSELRNALIQSARHGVISFQDARLLTQKAEIFFENREIEAPSGLVLELARTSRCSGYDCEFVALAKRLQTVLVTTDQRIVREFPQAVVALDQFVAREQKGDEND